MEQDKVSVIIPTLNAGVMIDALITKLEHQRRKPDEIIVVDSSSDDNTQELVRKHTNVKLLVIERKDFNHGGTRDYALRKSRGDFVLFLTQDALPKDDDYITHILEPFRDSQVALVYGRQIPRADASPSERIVRQYSYQAKSYAATEQDIHRMGIRALRATDVCAAYRRTAYEEVGGFDSPVLSNEDMFIAARFLHAGWKVVYEASAEVIHSHNFTFRQQYKRNYIQGVEIEKHKDILENVPLTGEGFAMLIHTVGSLLREGRPIEAGRFIIECGYRFAGNRKGIYDARTGRA